MRVGRDVRRRLYDSTEPGRRRRTFRSGSGFGSGEIGGAAAASTPSSPVADRRRSSPLVLVALRDVAIVSGLLSLFGAAEAWAEVSGLAFASLVATIDGFLVGAPRPGRSRHEWGHFAGARLGGGHAPLKPPKGLMRSFLPIFDFDYDEQPDGRAFEWMRLGGNIAHVAVPLVYLTARSARAGPGPLR